MSTEIIISNGSPIAANSLVLGESIGEAQVHGTTYILHLDANFPSAENVTFLPGSSSLSSTNVQTAIVELDSKTETNKIELDSTIATLASDTTAALATKADKVTTETRFDAVEDLVSSNKTELDSTIATLASDTTAALATKADKVTTETRFDAVEDLVSSNKTELDSTIATLASDTTAALATKADKVTTETRFDAVEDLVSSNKTELDSTIATLASDNTAALATKADKVTTETRFDAVEATVSSNKTELDSTIATLASDNTAALATKADKVTTETRFDAVEDLVSSNKTELDSTIATLASDNTAALATKADKVTTETRFDAVEATVSSNKTELDSTIATLASDNTAALATKADKVTTETRFDAVEDLVSSNKTELDSTIATLASDTIATKADKVTTETRFDAVEATVSSNKTELDSTIATLASDTTAALATKADKVNFVSKAEAGTAAYLDVTTSSTASSGILQVGDGGLLSAGLSITPSNIDTITADGSYFIDPTGVTGGLPPTVLLPFILKVTSGSISDSSTEESLRRVRQEAIFYQSSSQEIFYRTRYSTTSWTGWIKNIDSRNIISSPEIQSVISSLQSYSSNASNITSGTVSDARLPDTITSSITGNAATATKLATPRSISLTGDATGSVIFDGSSNVSITTTIGNASHTHTVSSITDFDSAVDAKIQALVGVAPAALDTLGEIAAQLSNDQNAVASLTATVATKLPSSSYTAADVLAKIKTVDGAGSGLDADLLDGQSSDFYRNASNLNSGTISDARLPDTITSSITGNAATATKLSTSESNWAGATENNVVGQLTWANYGNHHTIFDASKSMSPSGISKNNTNPEVPWSATYPTLMGFNGSSTYGVRVDISRYAEQLKTGRVINGTTFDGTGNITTSNWGSERQLTVGNTTKPVNGSGNVSWSQAEIGYTAADVLNKIKTVDGESSGLDADLLDSWEKRDIVPFQSGNDFLSGTLVTTSIDASISSGDSFVIEITGKAYGASAPHSVIAEGYIYNNTIINTSGVNLSGSALTTLKVMNLGGQLSIWWPRLGYWHSYSVVVRSSSQGLDSRNRVISIADSVDPTNATKKITINLAKSWTSDIDGAGSGLDADLLDGQQGSFYQNASNLTSGTIPNARLPATISSSTTGNAATATWADTVDVNGGNNSTSWYDVVWHSNDVLYSSTGVEIQGSTGSIQTAGTVNAKSGVNLGSTQQASIKYNATQNSIDFVIN